jgi:hypothetical protein
MVCGRSRSNVCITRVSSPSLKADTSERSSRREVISRALLLTLLECGNWTVASNGRAGRRIVIEGIPDKEKADPAREEIGRCIR